MLTLALKYPKFTPMKFSLDKSLVEAVGEVVAACNARVGLRAEEFVRSESWLKFTFLRRLQEGGDWAVEASTNKKRNNPSALITI